MRAVPVINDSPTRRFYGAKDIDRIPQFQAMSTEERDTMKAVAAVLPFRVNQYVLDSLIDWSAVPKDPTYQLTVPQPGMLASEDFERVFALVRGRASEAEVKAAAKEIQARMNPHPAGQQTLNVPKLQGDALPGIQHKYRETVLFFPTPGQTCFAYCTYCFRWAQFIGENEFKIAARETTELVEYLKKHPEVTNVLITGGDPMIMKTKLLRRYIEPLLGPGLEHLEAIRIGTKSTVFWPHRFVSDNDSDDMMRLFGEVRAAGKHLALMSHYSHPREMEPAPALAAVKRIQDAGAVIRSQSPLIRHVNDDANVWAQMWREQIRHGVVPYYMFIARDTGPKNYFEVPLGEASTIYNDAIRQVSGLARTVRGPSMSATPGKVLVEDVLEVGGEKVFALKLIQARAPSAVGHLFFAKYDKEASWLDELEPALMPWPDNIKS
ncbi:MAG: lysine 2,3-aminomutase [Myxococcales bacterium]|nr:lysine 2,3-aminomutase [Myxococcales bacterium]